MKWISTKDRLPEYGEDILAYRNLGDTYTIDLTEWDKEEEKYMKLNEITHWMPLPEPPKKAVILN